MPPVGFEPVIPAREQPQTHALDRAANRTGVLYRYGKSHVYAMANITFTTHVSVSGDYTSMWK